VSADDLEHAISRVAEALRVPVLIAALLALAIVLVELGRVAVEMWQRRRRSLQRLERAAAEARAALAADDEQRARDGLTSTMASGDARRYVSELLAHRDGGYDDWTAKALADFDYASIRRLERTRILVRVGPALGLMGTLIPLSPALGALARGDTAELAANLRVAFSVTVLGLVVGAIAFAISLVRDRLYSQELSDLEYLTSQLRPPGGTVTPMNALRTAASS
jgi:biopolymer transport protein ExbB/TolQ